MKKSDRAHQNGGDGVKLTPKQQVLMLLDQCLATGVRGRVQAVIKQAIAEIQGQGTASGYQHAESDINEPDYPGLIFKVGRHKRRWIYRYTPKGAKSTRQLTLGYFPQMDREAAIAAWNEQRLTQQGQAVTDQGTPLHLGVERFADWARSRRPRWRAELRQLESLFQGGLASRTGESLTLEEVTALVAPEKPGAKHRLSLLRLFFRVARGLESAEGWMSPGSACPCEGFSLARTTTLSHRIGWRELGRYHRAVLALEDAEALKPLLLMQLSNLVGFKSLCQLSWSQLDLDRGFARLQIDGKTRFLMLSPDTLAWLKRRHRDAAVGPWVFRCPTDASKPLPESYPVKLMSQLKGQCGLDRRFTTASIRELASLWLEEQGRAVPKRPWPLLEERPTEGQIGELFELSKMWVKRLHIQKSVS
ncbi:phage integrase family protein [Ferrimonas sediminicola]|uniref:Phage integrase family protein n=1 Tax=Ferrimonas sediminicola TaxID=2569538 RepID=A0A4U1BH54_9GAMM|nr:phage integrase family protein [Ferrimonas sediminicola]TKB50357.1 phage integrase family protein [Ferrimonas sediminicola]